MPVPTYAQGIQVSFLDTMTHARAKAAKEAAAATKPAETKTAEAAGPNAADRNAADEGEEGFSFDDFLDIVNPLQHLPVISTVYRALTGDQIKPLEKIAGGALYGGLPGLASSLADVAFERITGKDFGSTVMALFESGDDKAVASARPAEAATPQVATLHAAAGAPTPLITAQMMVPQPAVNNEALLASIQKNGIAPDLALRAAEAYRKTLGATAN